MGDMVVIRPDPFSRTSPRSIRRASRVRVARADRPMMAAIPQVAISSKIGLEDAADDANAQLGYAMGQILHREAEGQQAGIFDLQSVIEDRQPDRCTPLGIVGVDHRTDQGLAHGFRGQAPAVGAAHRADGGAMPGMLLHKGDRFLHGLHEEGVDLDPIQDAAPIAAGEAPGLNPGIWKVPLAVMAEEDHAAHCRHGLPLVVAHEPQGLQIATAEFAEGCERLGSHSEVDGFRA